MTGQRNFPKYCFCGSKNKNGFLCNVCADHIPAKILSEIQELTIDLLIEERQGREDSAKLLAEEIENIYIRNLKNEKIKSKSENPAAILGRISAKKAGFKGMSEKGKKGGTARAAALSPERRKEIARAGALARKAKIEARKKAKMADAE